MRSLMVSLADMIPAAGPGRSRHDAIDLPPSDGALFVLDEQALASEARAAADAAVLSLCGEDHLITRVDLRRVRALVEREVQVSRGGPVHLRPLVIYLDAFSSRALVTRAVRSVAEALGKLGLAVYA